MTRRVVSRLPVLAIALSALLPAAPLRAASGAPEAAIEAVRARAADYGALADRLWDLAEPAMREFDSAREVAEHLRHDGFRVEMGVAGMPTAFVATAGTSRPRIGFLIEYDALPGLSQESRAVRTPVAEGRPGHACNHNLLGAATVAAAEATAAVLRERGLPGTVVAYGTPAEETGVGKVFMARDGLFDDLDVVFNWHPGDENTASYGTTLAVNSVRFRFGGVAAHAAAAPERGRSALDAVELTNIAANFLREHVADDVRIHYAITGGGAAPNIVPEEAEVWYFVRAPQRAQVEEVYERVVRCARAGALATGTELTVSLESAFYEVNPNEALARVMDGYLRSLGVPVYTRDELAFAAELRASLGLPQGPAMAEEVTPAAGGWVFRASTDVGDVSWIAPTAILKVATMPRGCPLHSWQAVAAGGSGLGRSGMMLAAETMAAAATRLAVDAEALAAVRDEFHRSTEGFRFVSGMPAEIGPPVVEAPDGYPRGILPAR